MNLRPIAPNLWLDTAEGPRLLGARRKDGSISFPVPEGASETGLEMVELSPRGTLWSWTTQDFRPKSPYEGPEPFQPYIVGYVELPGELIVETRIVGASLDQLSVDLPMRLVVEPFDQERSIFAFTPEEVQ